MIIEFEELEAHRGKVAMVDGAFDPLHAGHVEYFEEGAVLGLRFSAIWPPTAISKASTSPSSSRPSAQR